jgi:hypothetical protein
MRPRPRPEDLVWTWAGGASQLGAVAQLVDAGSYHLPGLTTIRVRAPAALSTLREGRTEVVPSHANRTSNPQNRQGMTGARHLPSGSPPRPRIAASYAGPRRTSPMRRPRWRSRSTATLPPRARETADAERPLGPPWPRYGPTRTTGAQYGSSSRARIGSAGPERASLHSHVGRRQAQLVVLSGTVPLTVEGSSFRPLPLLAVRDSGVGRARVRTSLRGALVGRPRGTGKCRGPGHRADREARSMSWRVRPPLFGRHLGEASHRRVRARCRPTMVGRSPVAVCERKFEHRDSFERSSAG